MKKTERFGLCVPEQDDIYDVSGFAENMEIIDANLGGNEWRGSNTTISEDGKTITTVYEDGSKSISVFDETSITQYNYNANGEIESKIGTYISGNTIEEKELSANE